jgi:O-antigen/teichoic acid export membrane protein
MTAASPTDQLRGSSLLLVGRVLALGMDFAAQVLLVRYLSKSEFGAFALALAGVSLATSMALLGLERTTSRFAPIYHEQRDFGRMFGTIVLIVGTVALLGLAIVVLVYALRDVLGAYVVTDSEALGVLLILIVLAPLQALDSLLISLFATFSSARSIFVRRYLLAPALQLGVVLLLILQGSDLQFLAIGWVLAAAAGVAIYAVVLVGVLRREGLLARFRARELRLPIREIFSFSLPLLTSDVVFALRAAVVVLFLGAFGGTEEVADYRAVLPIAAQALLVATSFKYLFTPTVSRLFARGDAAGINDTYWQSAAWVAVLTFPIFAAGFALAEPVVALLFGDRYTSAATVLTVLAVGYYVHAAVGFNNLTLRVFARVRWMVIADLVTATVAVTASVLLLPRFGAVGAAVVTTGTMLLQNALYQLGLHRSTQVAGFDARYLRLYATLGFAAAAVLAVQATVDPPLVVGIALVVATWVVLVAVNRSSLRVVETFPEVARFPVARHLFGTRGSA